MINQVLQILRLHSDLKNLTYHKIKHVRVSNSEKVMHLLQIKLIKVTLPIQLLQRSYYKTKLITTMESNNHNHLFKKAINLSKINDSTIKVLMN